MWTEWQAGSRGPGLGRWLHFRAARGRSVVVAGSAALAGQDRRLEVSAPVEVRTAAYHASRCALASPPGSWVHLSGRWWSWVGVSLPATPRSLSAAGGRRGLTIRRSSAALRLLASPPSLACAAPGGGSRSHPGASAAACPTTQQTPTPQGVRGWLFMRCNGCLCLRFRLPGHLPGIYHFSNTCLTNIHGVSPCTQRFVPTFRD